LIGGVRTSVLVGQSVPDRRIEKVIVWTESVHGHFSGNAENADIAASAGNGKRRTLSYLH
jgi:hypothetical protein